MANLTLKAITIRMNMTMRESDIKAYKAEIRRRGHKVVYDSYVGWIIV